MASCVPSSRDSTPSPTPAPFKPSRDAAPDERTFDAPNANDDDDDDDDDDDAVAVIDFGAAPA